MSSAFHETDRDRSRYIGVFVLRVRSDRLFLIGNRTVLLCDPAKNIYEFHLLRR